MILSDITIKDIAGFVKGTVTGNADTKINSVSRIQDAESGALTFLYLPAFQKYFTETKASAIIVKKGFEKTRNDITYIEVDQPEKAFAKIVIHFFKPEIKLSGIDKSSFVHESASVGKNVALGKNVVISDGCKIGDNVKIFHNSVMLENVEVGEDSIIYQNVSIREDCKLGKRVIIHCGAVIGADGFGYSTDEKGIYNKIPQLGNVVLEDDVEIGANTTIDRAAFGSTIIGNGVKIDNLVQIAHNVTVGENTVMSGQVGVSGSTNIGKNSILAGQVGLAGHLEIGDGVVLLAQAGVSKSITKAGYYFGSPAKEFGAAKRIEAHIRNLPEYSEKIKNLESEISKLKEQLSKINQ
jgi:UDP-3-O-[3-hydroxymyristoyl] glucosamine N-acyltransferase